MDRPYRAVRAVARFWIWFFFRSIEVRHPERVPRAGPVLLAINHPNNLIDSLIVGAASARPSRARREARPESIWSTLAREARP